MNPQVLNSHVLKPQVSNPHVFARQNLGRFALWALAAALAAWLLAPALTPVPVEGFSAAIMSIGVHLAQGDVAAFDRLQPFNLEFFALSKLGAALGVAGAARFFGLGGMTALTLMMAAGEAIMLVCVFVLARRWSGAPAPLVVLVMLLTPGLAESAFFHNDNIPAAALTSAAFACFALGGLPGWAAGGALYGLAVLTRPDVAVAAVAAPLIAAMRFALTPRAAAALALAAIGGACAWLIPLHLAGASPLDILAVSRRAIVLWSRDPIYGRQVLEILVFLGAPALILTLAGGWTLAQRRERLAFAMLVAPIVVFNLVFAGKLWQARQLQPLAPFFVALAALGAQRIGAALRQAESPRLARAALAACLAAFALMPMPAFFDDGPRSFAGRLVSIQRWRDWQASTRADLAALDAAIAQADAGGLALLTDTWNSDRYAHQRLLDAGYRALPASATPPACAAIAEPFARGDLRVTHLRLHQSFVFESGHANRARFDEMATPCLAALGATRIIYATGADAPRPSGAAAPGEEAAFAQVLEALRFGAPQPLVAATLDADRRTRLRDVYVAVETRWREGLAALGRAPRSAAELDALTQAIGVYPKPGKDAGSAHAAAAPRRGAI